MIVLFKKFLLLILYTVAIANRLEIKVKEIQHIVGNPGNAHCSVCSGESKCFADTGTA